MVILPRTIVVVPILVGLLFCCTISSAHLSANVPFAHEEEEEQHHHHHHGRSVHAENGTVQRCGTPELTLSAEEEAKIRARIDSYGDTENKIFGIGEVTVDVSFQVIHNGAAGDIADQVITDQINVLNKAYAPFKFQFRLRETRRTNNAALYAACGQGQGTQRQFKPQLRNPSDGPNVLYFYTCDLGPANLLGYATFPTYYEGDPLLDGVVCSYTSLPGGTTPFDLGQTATHEVGHWLLLFHTFQGGCASPGDEVADTPAQQTPTSGCPTTNPDTCPAAGLDPIHNYMDYSDDICMTEFSNGQAERMHAAWDEYRSPSSAPTCDNFFIFIIAIIVKILTLGFVKLCV